MGKLEISKQNLIEIVAISLIFILIFIVGSSILLIFKLENYTIMAAWCFTTAIVVMLIIGVYTYLKLKAQI